MRTRKRKTEGIVAGDALAALFARYPEPSPVPRVQTVSIRASRQAAPAQATAAAAVAQLTKEQVQKIESSKRAARARAAALADSKIAANNAAAGEARWQLYKNIRLRM